MQTSEILSKIVDALEILEGELPKPGKHDYTSQYERKTFHQKIGMITQAIRQLMEDEHQEAMRSLLPQNQLSNNPND